MTKKEKQRLKVAINHFSDDEWEEGMDILFELLDWKKPSDKINGVNKPINKLNFEDN